MIDTSVYSLSSDKNNLVLRYNITGYSAAQIRLSSDDVEESFRACVAQALPSGAVVGGVTLDRDYKLDYVSASPAYDRPLSEMSTYKQLFQMLAASCLLAAYVAVGVPLTEFPPGGGSSGGGGASGDWIVVPDSRVPGGSGDGGWYIPKSDSLLGGHLIARSLNAYVSGNELMTTVGYPAFFGFGYSGEEPDTSFAGGEPPGQYHIINAPFLYFEGGTRLVTVGWLDASGSVFSCLLNVGQSIYSGLFKISLGYNQGPIVTGKQIGRAHV